MMRVPKSKTVLIAAIGAILAVCFYGLTFPRIPSHAGRPINAWFADLCSGVYAGTPKASEFEAAYAAFAQMGSNAVPYLTKQLHYDRSGFQEKLIGLMRGHAVSRQFAANLILPTEHRSFAAVALRQMGTNAEAAIPALLDACAYDTQAVRINAVSALEAILRGKHTAYAASTEWLKLESDVIAAATRRHPKLVEELGITTARVQ
jgi:hypothetical protein